MSVDLSMFARKLNKLNPLHHQALSSENPTARGQSTNISPLSKYKVFGNPPAVADVDGKGFS
jgi:hypothetical protein